MSARRTGISAVVERRQEWIASLRATLPHFAERTAAPLQRGHDAAVLGPTPRRLLRDAAAGRSTATALTPSATSPSLLLPDGWCEGVTQRLTSTLHGIVPPAHIRSSDLFLCALIHPTYVGPSTVQGDSDAARRRAQEEWRRTLCMPLELTTAGTKSLHVLHEVGRYVEAGAAAAAKRTPPPPTSSAAVGQSSRAPAQPPSLALEATWPQLSGGADSQAFLHAFRSAGLEAQVLYDRAFFAHAGAAVPDEVALAAFTALCGGIELVSGWASLVEFVDRVSREHSAAAS